MTNQNQNQNQRTPSTPHIAPQHGSSLTLRARPIAYDYGESEHNDQVGVQFEITQEGDHAGKRITWYSTFSEAQWEITTKALMAMGALKNGDVLDKSWLDTAEEVSLVIEVEPDTQNGGHRSRVKWVNGLQGTVAFKRKHDSARAAKFQQRVRAMHAKLAGQNGASGTLPPVRNNQNAGRDDVPMGEPPPWMR